MECNGDSPATKNYKGLAPEMWQARPNWPTKMPIYMHNKCQTEANKVKKKKKQWKKLEQLFWHLHDIIYIYIISMIIHIHTYILSMISPTKTDQTQLRGTWLCSFSPSHGPGEAPVVPLPGLVAPKRRPGLKQSLGGLGMCQGGHWD